MENVKYENAHFNVDGNFPENITEANKLLSIIRFWNMFAPEVREVFMQFVNNDLFSIEQGAILSILVSLSKIDVNKLEREVSDQDTSETDCFWRRMSDRLSCGCISLDCGTHGAYDVEDLERMEKANFKFYQRARR